MAVCGVDEQHRVLGSDDDWHDVHHNLLTAAAMSAAKQNMTTTMETAATSMFNAARKYRVLKKDMTTNAAAVNAVEKRRLTLP